MPFGGNDWLALTQEPTLEPDLPICDPHHHFWDFRSERIPYQRYLLHELADDINSGHNVRSTVFVEARAMYREGGPEEMRSVGEVEFVQGLAAASASGVYGPGRGAASVWMNCITVRYRKTGSRYAGTCFRRSDDIKVTADRRTLSAADSDLSRWTHRAPGRHPES